METASPIDAYPRVSQRLTQAPISSACNLSRKCPSSYPDSPTSLDSCCGSLHLMPQICYHPHHSFSTYNSCNNHLRDADSPGFLPNISILYHFFHLGIFSIPRTLNVRRGCLLFFKCFSPKLKRHHI